MPETLGAAPLVTAIESLRTALESTPLDLAIGGGAESRRERTAVIGQIQDYLLPRLQRLDAPLLTVVGGSTGAGKSTLVNGLVGTTVTTAGVLRPTTRAPVLVCNPDDRDWFATDRILPGLARTTGGPPPLPLTDAPAACSWRPHPRSPAGSPCSTPRMSTRWSPPTASWPPSCWPPRTCGCSSPPRSGTPTRSPGSCCTPRRSAAPPSRWYWTGFPPRRHPRSPRTLSLIHISEPTRLRRIS